METAVIEKIISVNHVRWWYHTVHRDRSEKYCTVYAFWNSERKRKTYLITTNWCWQADVGITEASEQKAWHQGSDLNVTIIQLEDEIKNQTGSRSLRCKQANYRFLGISSSTRDRFRETQLWMLKFLCIVRVLVLYRLSLDSLISAWKSCRQWAVGTRNVDRNEMEADRFAFTWDGRIVYNLSPVEKLSSSASSILYAKSPGDT